MGKIDGLRISLGDWYMSWMEEYFVFQISILSISVTFRNINFDRSLLKYSYDALDYRRYVFNVLFFEFAKKGNTGGSDD